MSNLDNIARTAKLSAARDLIRSAKLHDNDELFAFVNTLIASCEFRSSATDIPRDANTNRSSTMCPTESSVSAHFPKTNAVPHTDPAAASAA